MLSRLMILFGGGSLGGPENEGLSRLGLTHELLVHMCGLLSWMVSETERERVAKR